MSEQTTTDPTIRMRIEHTHTRNDGWRLSSTTVEYTGPAPANGELIAAEMRRAYLFGDVEADYRNQPAIDDEVEA